MTESVRYNDIKSGYFIFRGKVTKKQVETKINYYLCSQKVCRYMKKQLFLILAMLMPLAGVAQQTPMVVCTESGLVKGVQNTMGCQLKVGDVTMTVNPAKGGKIMSLTYKGKEIISQLTAPESFGSTFWTSPQKEWYWPPVKEFDKMPYTVMETPSGDSQQGFTLISEVSEKLKYRVRKTFATDEQHNAIVVTYSIVNESDETRQVAPWEITRVVNDGGVIFFDAPLDGITPSGLMDFHAAHGAVWYHPDEAGENRKINADGKGWLAYCNHGLLLVKTFDDLPAIAQGAKEGTPAPDEAEIQVYVNRGKTYIELESQGAYTTLKPHEQLCWTVRWHLLPVEGDAQPSKQLVETVKKLLSLHS
jgi:hypothetical protein